MVYVLLADGFEESEAVVTADILHRSGAQVALVGVTGETVSGDHGIAIRSDIPLDAVNPADMELLVLPGGMGGVENLYASGKVRDLVQKAADGPGLLGAICAAPTILGKMGLLEGRKAVCYPGLEEDLKGADVQEEEDVVVDGNIITGRGPGAAAAFGLELAGLLKGPETADDVAADGCWYI